MKNRKKAGRKPIPGSLRQEGFASLGVSAPTRDKIKKLANDSNMPVSEYLKELVKSVKDGKPVPRATMAAAIEQLVEQNERQVAQNVIIAAEMKALRESYSKIELFITDIYRMAGGRKTINTGIRKTIKNVAKPPKTKLEKGGVGA